ncbi:galactosyl transferase [Geopyxis carbonaria]|nr:galactosyl transferase [Geopyxis carbonaria]
MLLPTDNTTTHDYGAFPATCPWLHHALQNRAHYAQLHNYTLHAADLALYPEYLTSPQWAKIAALHAALTAAPPDDAEWIWMLDSDAIIMTPSVPIHRLLTPAGMREHVIPNATVRFGGWPHHPEHRVRAALTAPAPINPASIDLVISQDTNGLNTGSVLIRRSAYMSAFVDLWRDPYFVRAGFTFNEQDALAHLLIAHPAAAARVGVVEQRLLNAYPFPDEEAKWRVGDLLVHFAGCREATAGQAKGVCDRIFRDYWMHRGRVREPGW